MITPQEFSGQYQQYLGYTQRYLRKALSISVDRAEELAQAAWVRAWEQRAQWRAEAKFSSWVNHIAYNIFLTELRKGANRLLPLKEVESFEDSILRRVDAGLILAPLDKSKMVFLQAYYWAPGTRSKVDRLRAKRLRDLIRFWYFTPDKGERARAAYLLKIPFRAQIAA